MNFKKNKKEIRKISIFFAGILSIAMCFSIFVGNTVVNANENTSESTKSDITPPKDLKQVGYDVVYVIDNSRSVWSQQADRDRAFKNITNLAVGADIHIGGIYFANEPYSKIGFKSMENKNDCEDVLAFLNMHSLNSKENYNEINARNDDNIHTNITEGLSYAKELLSASDPTRERVVVLFSDGKNDAEGATDEKSYEVAKELGDIHAKIYCVYLAKDYSAVEVLKQIVNYGLAEGDPNYEDYTEKRFHEVNIEKISELSSRFVKVFYDMQENMKYHEVDIDSSGNDQFFVPTLGITKLRVYLQGVFKEGTELIPPRESEYDKWSEGNAVFLEYRKPVPGLWKIKVNSPDQEAVEGTVTYYVNLAAQAEVVSDKESKNKRLVVYFFDKNQNEIAIDDGATVTATLEFKGENGFEKSTPLKMSIDNGVATSGLFEMKGYGNYNYSVDLTYKDLIDLSYHIAGPTITKHAPATTNINGREFSAEKTNSGLVFAIKESELWSDPEEEAVTVVGVTPINVANPIKCDQRDGYVYVTAERAGDIDFSLSLEDASGMEAVVTVKGSVIDQGFVRNMQNGTIIAAIVVILIICMLLYNKQRKKSKLTKLFGSYEQTEAEYKGIEAVCNSKEREYHDMQDRLIECLHGNDDVPGLVEMAAQLTEEQLSMFGLTEFIENGYEDRVLSEGSENCARMDAIKEKMKNLSIQVNAVRDNQKNVNSSIRSMKEHCSKADEYKKALSRELTEIEENSGKISGVLSKIDEVGMQVAIMLNTPITCKLTVKDISIIPGVRGAMNPKSNKIRDGYYELESIQLLNGQGSLRSKLGHIGIYVYGYNNEEINESGLKLVGSKEFEVGTSLGNTKKVSEVHLKEGKEYEITVNSPMVRGRVSMTLKIG